jgi:single-stranded DNA-binding protein
MNNCLFTGYLYDEPEVTKDNGGTEYCEFTLLVYEYFRNKRGEKKRHSTYLRFMAWDSGARTIAKLGSQGMKMTINASAKNIEDESDTDVIFRVNQFDFGCLDKD